jgi:hypothetical protein
MSWVFLIARWVVGFPHTPHTASIRKRLRLRPDRACVSPTEEEGRRQGARQGANVESHCESDSGAPIRERQGSGSSGDLGEVHRKGGKFDTRYRRSRPVPSSTTQVGPSPLPRHLLKLGTFGTVPEHTEDVRRLDCSLISTFTHHSTK